MPTKRLNKFDQEIGYLVDGWHTRNVPQRIIIEGTYCTLEPLESEKHGQQLYESFKCDDSIWTYVPIGPFDDFESFKVLLDEKSTANDEVHFAIVNNETKCAIGSIALINIQQEAGSIEVGYVLYSPVLRRTAMATEAQYILMRYVFDVLRYRRHEWKCDNLNRPSRKAAIRLGFTFELVFRQAAVYKGRNRDTAWFSIIDKEWRQCQSVLEKWLSKENFENGIQKKSLDEIRKTCQEGV